MKKYVMYLFITTCFLRAAQSEELLTEPHPTPLARAISQLNDPNIDPITLRELWSMCDFYLSLRAPVATVVERRISEPNADPTILQLAKDIGEYYVKYPGLREIERRIVEPNVNPAILQSARDIGKYYANYPGLREQVATIVRRKLTEPRIDPAILQLGLSMAEIYPDLGQQTKDIILGQFVGENTPPAILQLLLQISPELREQVMTIIDGKITGTDTDPFMLTLALDTRNRGLCEKVATIVRDIFAENKPVIHPIILWLGWHMRIGHPELAEQAKSIVTSKLIEPVRNSFILDLAQSMGIR